LFYFALSWVTITGAASAQSTPRSTPPSAWGIAPNARYLPSHARVVHIGPRVEFVSDGPPQTVALYLGVVERGTARLTQSESVYRDLCTTPCAREFAPRAYDLFTHGPGVVSGLHRYVVPPGGVRFHLRARPAGAAIRAGLALAIGVLATIGSVALFANASFSHTDDTPGWIVLGGAAAFWLAGTVLNFWAQSTGISATEPLGAAPSH